ncbi:ECs1072 family phage-associated protein [Klebsiella oxytoca]|uniref:ECs1072 family phage-associated protein n=1 Tax=Klebsiella oxytoca TaxID=571 RepID=UPI00094952E3|nr:hypothetical protein [Klebsiella oxytoca]
MSNYLGLFQSIKIRVCRNNNFPVESLRDTSEIRTKKILYRIGQIYTLECVLSEYKKYFSSYYFHMSNKQALHHLIFDITKWKLEDIKELSLNDCLFIIAGQLKPDYMSEDAAQFLLSNELPTGHYSVDDFPDSDWNPDENSVYHQTD